MTIFELPRFEMRNFQSIIVNEYLDGHKRFAISVTRRGGKDYIGLTLAYMQCILKAGSNVGYLGLSLKSLKKILMSNDGQGRPMFESVIDCKNALIPTKSGAWFHKETSCFKFKNGSILYLLGTDQSMELGTSMDMLVVTEAGRIPFKAWEFLVPSIEGSNGTIIQISTPFFGSEFNELLDGSHKASSNYRIHVVPANTLLHCDGRRVYPDAQLARIKREMNTASFMQDYMCSTKAINSISVMGESIDKARIVNRPYLAPTAEENKHNGMRMICAFDLGQADSCALTIALAPWGEKPVIIDYVVKNRTQLSYFTEYIKRLRAELNIDPYFVEIALPFDADHEMQGYEGLVNRYQEFKKHMSNYQIHLVKKVSKIRKLEVMRDVLEVGDLHLEGFDGHLTPTMESYKKVIASINYKTKGSSTVIDVYEVDKKSGVHGDHPLDSLSYLVVFLFKNRFTGDYDDIRARQYADELEREREYIDDQRRMEEEVERLMEEARN